MKERIKGGEEGKSGIETEKEKKTKTPTHLGHTGKIGYHF